MCVVHNVERIAFTRSFFNVTLPLSVLISIYKEYKTIEWMTGYLWPVCAHEKKDYVEGCRCVLEAREKCHFNLLSLLIQWVNTVQSWMLSLNCCDYWSPFMALHRFTRFSFTAKTGSSDKELFYVSSTPLSPPLLCATRWETNLHSSVKIVQCNSLSSGQFYTYTTLLLSQ